MRRSDPEAGTRKASSGLDEQELQEIVASELESSGVQDADLARRLVGRLLSFVDPKPALSFREIENILFGAGSDGGEHDEPSTPKKVRDRVAEHVLAAYALQEVTPRAAVRASAAGRIHLHAIESPVRLETLRLRLPRIGSDGLRSTLSYDRLPFTSRTVSRESFDLATFLTSVARLRQYTSGELAISGLPALLFDPVTQGRDAEEKARDVIERLARFPSRPTIVLELGPDDDASTWLRALTGLPESHTRSLVFRLRGVGADPLRRGAIGRAVGLASRLHARGERLEFYPAPIYARFPPESEGDTDTSFATPWASGESGFFPRPRLPDAIDKRRPLTGSVGKISVLLAALGAHHEGRGRDSALPRSFLEELEDLVEIAVETFEARLAFVRRLADGRERPLWALLGEREGGRAMDPETDLECVLGVVGLDDCVERLCGRELHESPLAMTLGIAIIRALDVAVRNAIAARGIRVRLEETRAHEIVSRREVAIVEPLPEAFPGTDGVRLSAKAPVDPLRRIEDVLKFVPYLGLRGGLVEEGAVGPGACELLPGLLTEAAAAVMRLTDGGVPGGQFLG